MNEQRTMARKPKPSAQETGTREGLASRGTSHSRSHEGTGLLPAVVLTGARGPRGRGGSLCRVEAPGLASTSPEPTRAWQLHSEASV